MYDAASLPALRAGRAPATADARLAGTRWPFAALCCFIASQAYTIPILPIGPWALWPRLSDIAAALLIASALLARRHLAAPTAAHRRLLWHCAAIAWLAALSYCVYLFAPPWRAAAGGPNGAFQLYTLAWFFGVFLAASHIPLSPARVATLRRVLDVALAVVLAGVILTALDIVSLPSLTPQLPRGIAQAGPWHRYGLTLAQAGGDRGGWGTIGYNHAYVAAQILLLAGLRLSLDRRAHTVYGGLMLPATLLAIFLTHSRAGFAAGVLFALTSWARSPRQALVGLALVAAAGLLALAVVPPQQLSRGLERAGVIETLERQETLADPTDPENLSGRTAIWQQRVAFLDAAPLRWLVGAGFGAANDGGASNAHMLPLHIITELGVVGLALFAALFAQIIRALARAEAAGKPLLWATVALLVASLTQETFYPVPSQGYFFGFYLCAVAIALRSHSGEPMAARADETEERLPPCASALP